MSHRYRLLEYESVLEDVSVDSGASTLWLYMGIIPSVSVWGAQVNVHQRSDARHITRLISINLCCTKLKIMTRHLEILASYHFL